jgi:CrcB protein
MIYVGLGGCIGSILRYSMTLIMRNISGTYPLGTLISNITGCFIIGIVIALSSEIPMLSSEMRLFLATGICGGFTTLSSFVYELAQFSKESQYAMAAFYFCATFFGSFIAFAAGLALTRFVYKG